MAATGQWQNEVANMFLSLLNRSMRKQVIKDDLFPTVSLFLCLLNSYTGGYPEVSHEHRSVTEVADS